MTPDETVLAQLAEVRESGLANMADRRMVQRAAHDLDLADLVVFIEETLLDRRSGMATYAAHLTELGARAGKEEAR